MKKQSIQNWHKYHVPGQSHHTTRPRNAVFVSAANSIEHETFKFLGAIMVQRFGDVLINETIKEKVAELIFQIRFRGGEELKEKNEFITEAVPNDRPKRRVDLVNLTTLDEIEFETDHKIMKNGAITIFI